MLTEQLYREARAELKTLIRLCESELTEEQCDRIEMLVNGIEEYECDHFHFPKPTVEELTTFRQEQQARSE